VLCQGDGQVPPGKGEEGQAAQFCVVRAAAVRN
jgi:hypothetical protein